MSKLAKEGNNNGGDGLWLIREDGVVGLRMEGERDRKRGTTKKNREKPTSLRVTSNGDLSFDCYQIWVYCLWCYNCYLRIGKVGLFRVYSKITSQNAVP